MRRLLANRWFRRSPFVALLIGLGVAIYRYQPHEPRWTFSPKVAFVSADTSQLKFSSDGRFLFAGPPATVRRIEWKRSPPYWPVKPMLQIWDVATGKAIPAHPATGEIIGHYALSRDCRHFAGECLSHCADGKTRVVLCLADLHSGEERDIALPVTDDGFQVVFSPCGKFLATVGPKSEAEQKERSLRIYETATCKLLDERPSVGILYQTGFTDEYLIHTASEKGNERRLEFWSLAERKPVAVLDHSYWGPQVSPDGRFLLTRTKSSTEKDEPNWLVWNLQCRKLQTQFRSEMGHVATMSANGEWVVLRGEEIELRELATGKCLATLPEFRFGQQALFSPDSRFLAFNGVPQNDLWGGKRRQPRGLNLIDVATFQEIWDDSHNVSCRFQFSNDSRRIIHAREQSSDVSILDSETGIPLAIIDRTTKGRAYNHLNLTPDGRFLLARDKDNEFPWGIWLTVTEPFWKRALRWIRIDPDRFDQKHHDETIVYDMESNRERLRLFGWDISDALLSDDGSTLITTHREEDGNVMRCWDVGGFKPFRWAIGVPTAVGVLLYGLAKGFGRWRKRRRAVVGATPPKPVGS